MKEHIKSALSKSDPVLGQIIQQILEPTFCSTGDVFHDLMSCILEQQIHYRSTKKTFQKLLDAAKLERLTPANFSQFEETAFDKLKLSETKYQTITQVLDFWEQHDTPWRNLSDAEVIATLSTIKGIGKWTIDMILMYTLERPNVFPYDDYHLKLIMTSAYELDPKVKLKAQMMHIADKWGDQKSMAVQYLLAYKKYQGSLQ